MLLFAAVTAVSDDLPTVTVARPGANGVAPELRFTGTVTADQHAALSPRVSGLVASLKVDAGDRVKKGAVLLELDAALAELSLGRTRAALREAEVRLTEQERVRDDMQVLVATSTIAKTQARTAEAEAEMAAAAVVRLRAEVNHAAEIVARHRLLAPFDGVVRRRLAEVGEWVDTSSPVIELVTVAPVRLEVQVPQERYASIAPDQPVSVQLDALPGRSFDARVLTRVPVSDPASRTFLVRVVIDSPEGVVIPGMSGQATFRLAAGDGRVTVPRDAVIRGTDGATRLWLVDGSGEAGAARVSVRVVTLGRSQDGQVEVVSGLPAGSLVVVRGNEGLRDGQNVRVVATE